MSYSLGIEHEIACCGFGTHDLRFYGIELIDKILKVVGVDAWEKLPGKHIRVKRQHQTIIDIGHIIKDRWLNLDAMAERIRKEKASD